MTEDRARATCTDCGKTYRVPDADRTYTCKECGGEVRVAEPARPGRREVDFAESNAAHDLRKAHKAIRAVRTFFVLSAVMAYLATLLAIRMLDGGNNVETAGLVAIGILATIAAAAVAGALLVAYQPFFWDLAMAL